MNPLFTSHIITTTSHGNLSGKPSKPKILPSKNEIRCTKCQTILNSTCLVIMDHGEPIYYFCNKQCKKDYVRVNGMIK